MGALLDKPITEKETTVGSTNEIRYAHSSMQGFRPEMEDCHIVCPHLPRLSNTSLFCILDGHGGSFTSAYVAKYFMRKLNEIEEYEFYATLPAQSLRDHRIGIEIIQAAMKRAFIEIDREMMLEDYESRWCKKDLNTGKILLDESGCTCLIVVITPKHIISVNAGDCRACYRTSGKTIQLSYDHKPHHDEEQNRIEAAGGYVQMKRVDGDLAVSRGLGDFRYKTNDDLPPERQKVSCIPEFVVYDRDVKSDEFLIMACDGVWDVMEKGKYTGCDACMELVQNMFDEGETDLGIICEDLLDICLERESKDNMSAILVAFSGVNIRNAEEGQDPNGDVDCANVEVRRARRRALVEKERQVKAEKQRVKRELKSEASLVRMRLLERARREEAESDSD